jgi:hypothetical protein
VWPISGAQRLPLDGPATAEHRQVTAAAEHIPATLGEVAIAITGRVRDTVAVHLGREAAMQVGAPDTTGLAASLDEAITTAAGNVQATLAAATEPDPAPQRRAPT